VTKPRWARVLIVEDSPTAGKVLSEGIARDNRLAVAGVATTAQDAVAMAETLQPDVMTLDLMLPDETGLRVIQRILARRHLPIIVVTSLPVEGTDSLPFRALATGAMDLVAKPAGDAVSLKRFFLDLNERLASIAAAVAVPTHDVGVTHTTIAMPHHSGDLALDCVVVGASTGGPPAIVELLNGLGTDFPAPVIIVQHIAAPFVDGLVRWLDKETPMRVSLAEDGELPRPKHAYVAPAGCDVTIDKNGRMNVKKVSADRRAIAPSADLLFETAAETFRGRCAGVLLTGMGRDGAAGLLKMRARGARTFAQDERSCVVFGMPASAGRMGAVEAFAEPKVIAARLRRLVARNERLA
jgi:two-component system, chemotaxis family, protein-glutamate methylesterase/glutaminase